jgi:hypothetical protein
MRLTILEARKEQYKTFETQPQSRRQIQFGNNPAPSYPHLILRCPRDEAGLDQQVGLAARHLSPLGERCETLQLAA